MNSRPRLPRFALRLLPLCCFLCLPSPATNEPSVRQTSAAQVPSANSSWHQETTQPSQTADQQSPAKDPNPLFPVVEHGKWGYMDQQGKVVITPQYYDAGTFKEGIARVEPWAVIGGRGLRIYFINKSGNILNLSKIYSEAQDFSDGLALVEVPGERGLGYIDSTAQMVIPQNDSYQAARPFREGFAAIKQGGKWGYIDKTGKVVIEVQFSEAFRFSGGLAAVKSGERWGYIDKSGKMAITAQYEMAYQHEEGLAAVKQDGKWGFIDTSGTLVIPPQFEDAYGFSEGLVDVKVGGKWGYCDKNGKMVIAAKYDGAQAHFEGLAGVKLGGKWGYIDKTGTMIISPQFDEASGFSEGLALVKVGKKLGYIEKTGKYVWAPTK